MLMKMKKVLSALCAAAVLLSSVIGGNMLFSPKTVNADETHEESAAGSAAEIGEESGTKRLAAPENLRCEDGFIKWDKVKEAYGYTLRMYISGEETREFTRYFDYYDPDNEAEVELDRLCFENNIDFGGYTFDVCIFDEEGNTSEWTKTITAEYAPTLDAPTNVRLRETDEETVEWDGVEGAYRYNIRVYKDDDDRSLQYNTYSDCNWCSHTLFSWLETGNYLFSVQTMDQDYSVSQWTEPIKVSHIVQAQLEAPQNVRLDESGETILWDEVEGAKYYQVNIWFVTLKNDGYETVNIWPYYGEQTQLLNWKSNVIPSSEGEYRISVCACDSSGSSDWSDTLTVPYEPVCNETIELPEALRLEDGYFRWDSAEGAKTYYMFILCNGKYIENEYTHYNVDSYIGDSDAASVELTYYMGGNMLPEGSYEAELFVVDENGNYNSKIYSFALDTPHDETIWVPKIFYKGDVLLWDYDRIRHDNTDFFWIRIKNAKDNTVIKLDKSWSEYIYGLNELPNGEYIIEICVYEYLDKLGPWSKPLNVTVHNGSLFDEENESTEEIVIPPEIEETVPEEDRITSITINPAFNMKHKDGDDVELDLSKIEIKAKEIYDEEGLKRVEEALGHKIKKNQKYNLLDLTLLYKGEDFSNGYEGLVKVIIPIPSGHRDKTFTVYRLTEIDGQTVKEVIPGEQTEDSYIIYLEHFSEYVLFGEGEDEHTHIFPEEWTSDETNHWKECECGEKSEESAHTYGDWTVTKEATEAEEGSKERACGVCGYKETESLPKLSPVTPSETEKPDDKNQNTGVAASVSSVSALLISGGLIILLSGKRKVK